MNINIVLSSGGLFSRYVAMRVIEENRDEQLVLLHALSNDKEKNKINIDSVYHTQELIHEKYGLTPMVITTSYDYDISNFTLDTVSLLTSVFSKYIKSDDTILGNIFSNHYNIFTGVTFFNNFEKSKTDLESNMECISSAMNAVGIDSSMFASLLSFYSTKSIITRIWESTPEVFSYPVSIGKDVINNIFMGYISGNYNLDDKFIKSIFNNGNGIKYLNDMLGKIFELTDESFIKIPFIHDFVNSFNPKQEKKQQKAKKESTTVLKKKENVSSDSITSPPSNNKISNIELPKIEPITSREPATIKYDTNNGNEEFTEDIIESWMNKEISGDVAADKLNIPIHDFYSLARKYKNKK